MKILNWIHHKLYPSCSNYSQVPQKKDVLGVDDGGEPALRDETAEATAEKETKALLLHDMLKDILTIGTLGHGHPLLLPTYCASADEEFVEEQVEQEEDSPPPPPEEVVEETEEIAAPVLKAAAAIDRLAEITVDTFKTKFSQEEAKKTELVAVQELEIEKILELPLLKEAKEKTEEGRTRTMLADLFAADASFNEQAPKEINLRGNYSDNQEAAHEKKKKKKKKEQPKKKNAEKSTSPTTTFTGKKLQKLITRMLKKKIYPEMATAATAKEMAKQSSAAAEKPLIVGQIASDLL